MSSGRALVATFGFDIDFVLRRLAGEKPDEVILLSLYTSEDAFRRVEKAYHTLSVVCRSMNIECRLEKFESDKLFRGVLSLLSGIAEQFENVEVYLTGGPRMLVVATAISALMLPRHLARKVKLVVEGEGFECEASVDMATLIDILKLDERGLAIVTTLQVLGTTKVSELAGETGIPKSTLYRRLEELENMGLVKRVVIPEEGEKYTARDVLRIQCK